MSVCVCVCVYVNVALKYTIFFLNLCNITKNRMQITSNCCTFWVVYCSGFLQHAFLKIH